MPNEWIIDVLGDLRAFAADNDMPTLADQIEEALTVAAVEIAQNGVDRMRADVYDGTAGTSAGAAL